MVPASTATFIELDHLAALRAEAENDPLTQQLRREFPHPVPPAWAQVQTMLGLSGEQIIDRYFGQALAVAAQRPGPGAPSVVISVITDADAKLAIARLGLVKDQQVGPFSLYRTSDGKGRIAFAPGWMVMADAANADWLTTVLHQAGQPGSLADDAEFRRWTAKLPADRTVTLFARVPQEHAVHALAVVRRGLSFMLSYRGESDGFAALSSKAGRAGAADFGPLSATTIAAASVNLFKRHPAPGQSQVMDRLVAPRSWEKDVLPKIGAPGLLFWGEAADDKAADVAPRPAAGIGIRMSDPSVASDLDRAMANVLLLANMATMSSGVPAMASSVAAYRGHAYHVVEIGQTLAESLHQPDLRLVGRVSYGAVGPWYILTTQEDFYRRCLDAEADRGPKLASTPEVAAMPLAGAPQPAATVVIRCQELSHQVRGVFRQLASQHPWAAKGAAEPRAGEPDERPMVQLLRGLRVVSEISGHYSRISLVSRLEGDRGMAAELELIRR